MCVTLRKEEKRTNKKTDNVEFTNQKGEEKNRLSVSLVLPYFIYALKRGSACGFPLSPCRLWLGFAAGCHV